MVTPEEIAAYVKKLGYEAKVLSNVADSDNSVSLTITGMTCSSCVAIIERTVRKLPGVYSASVALTTKKGYFEYDPTLTGPRQIIHAIKVSLLVQPHPSVPPICSTHLLHPSTSPICSTHLLHLSASPIYFTYLLHPSTSPICFTYLLHPSTSPICSTHLFHPSVPAICSTYLLHLSANIFNLYF